MLKHILHIFDILVNLQRTYELHKSRLYDVYHYPSSAIKKRVNKFRNKETICVAFIVYDISKWKSEALYLAMLNNRRFKPIIVPVMSFRSDYIENQRQFDLCVRYLKERCYDYTVGNPNFDIDKLVNPDIVFYGELYEGIFDDAYAFRYNSKRTSLACYVPYCFHNTNISSTINHLENNLVWLSFVENSTTLNDMKSILTNRGANHVTTGLPIQDSFINAKETSVDIWKTQKKHKKRIIWAPSHTIKGDNIENAYEQSTFLEIADDMLILADKYKEEIQWAFKPHPVLRRKLLNIWGQERTDNYYSKWNTMDNTQLEEGQYVDLFYHSDAMIHDCMSFMVEYMYTENPILFLDNGNVNRSILNTQTNEALDLHYKGKNIADIENFIIHNVIGEDDPLKHHRIEYREKYLVPPHRNTACQNIIKTILGEE